MLDVPDGQPGMTRVQTDGAKNGVRVRTIRFDDWLDAAKFARVTVCKVDVEGHEPAVFRGMESSLTANRIGAFVFERHGAAGPNDEVIVLLRRHGYRVLQILKRWRAVEYVDAGCVGRGSPTADFVAVRPGSEHEQ